MWKDEIHLHKFVRIVNPKCTLKRFFRGVFVRFSFVSIYSSLQACNVFELSQPEELHCSCFYLALLSFLFPTCASSGPHRICMETSPVCFAGSFQTGYHDREVKGTARKYAFSRDPCINISFTLDAQFYCFSFRISSVCN